MSDWHLLCMKTVQEIIDNDVEGVSRLGLAAMETS